MMEGSHLELKRLGAKLCACLLAGSLALLCPVAPRTAASADPVDDARAALDAAEARMQAISAEYEALAAEIAELQERIDETAAEAMVVQQAVIEGRERLGEAVAYDYRSGTAMTLLSLVLDSGSFSELLDNMEYVSQIGEFYADEIRAQKERRAELEAIGVELDERKAAQDEALASLEEKQAEAESVVSAASAQLSDAEAAEAARLAALQAAADQMQQTPGSDRGNDFVMDPNADTVDREDAVQGGSQPSSGSESSDPSASQGSSESDSGWKTGTASAYGGSTDPSTPNPGTTATGALCDDWSMGVAVPMSMPNYRSYFGRTVEIGYNGMTVYATVNDCGGMGGGSRVLDLQPGVWKAFGFSSCRGWGLRTVSYRFL